MVNELPNSEGKKTNQSDFARELEKDRQVIQKLETGVMNPTVKTLQKIAYALDIDITDFIKNSLKDVRVKFVSPQDIEI
jgi:transcriptional regulator with XRE-family HTH domain